MSVRFVGNIVMIPTYILHRKFGTCDKFFLALACSHNDGRGARALMEWGKRATYKGAPFP